MSQTEKRELNRKELIEKYPEFPALLVLKVDTSKRGIIWSDKVFDYIRETGKYSLTEDGQIDGKDSFFLGLTLRDGTTLSGPPLSKNAQEFVGNPYLLDIVDGKLVLIDKDEIVEEAYLWDKPDYADKFTSNGTPMSTIIQARPQKLDITPNHVCHFWDKGEGCRFCGMFAENRGKVNEGRDYDKFYQDVYESVSEALKEKGRGATLSMSSGTTLSGKELFDDELELYIKTYQAAGRAFKTKKFPSQLVGSAYNERQLCRLYEETGLMSYSADIEVINKRLFEWICPGKAHEVGYEEWKNRLYKAVEIFGRGYVNTSVVGGVELAKPNGFETEDKALEAVLEEANIMASHGISFADSIWHAAPKSVFYNQKTPSAEYHVRLAIGLAEVRRKHGLNIYTDDYRRCGNHPNTDLARID